MTARTFQSISRSRWLAIQRAFQAQAGAAISGDFGHGTSHGVNFAWNYVEPELTLTVEHVPWVYMLSESDVLDKFGTWIAGVQ